ncbi:class II histocompatibility antigen, M alpha chain isoform X3 [Gopherus flavomarginatus]|uniref:class II histocompatibility antigen, M alpha chain isoform X3 n=1 Tax=Gopherus flavomarginatus TaxID=286002 RepID=UPI0021CBC661|nr:class II histocompatibility antigen, M alpha chain isoform X3 [Gopherus flavomarginatus]
MAPPAIPDTVLPLPETRGTRHTVSPSARVSPSTRVPPTAPPAIPDTALPLPEARGTRHTVSPSPRVSPSTRVPPTAPPAIPDTALPLPEARGTPMANVFTAQPLELGKPNTLICQVGNLFPASVTVSWQRLGEPVSQGVNTTRYYPTEELGFLLFSYLEFIPQEGDIYTCTVTRPRDRFSTVAYWVPQNPIPSELLENALCGLAIALGIFFMVTGIVLLLKSRRPSPTE